MKIEKLGVKELRVSRDRSDIYKIQNLKYKQQDIIRIIFR